MTFIVLLLSVPTEGQRAKVSGKRAAYDLHLWQHAVLVLGTRLGW